MQVFEQGPFVPIAMLFLWLAALLLNLVVLIGRDFAGDNMSAPSLAISAAIMALALLDLKRARPRHHAFHAFGAPFIAIVIQSWWMADKNKVQCTLSELETVGTPSRNYDFRCNLFYAATAAVCAAYAAGLGLVMARAWKTFRPKTKTNAQESQPLNDGNRKTKGVEIEMANMFKPLRLSLP